MSVPKTTSFGMSLLYSAAICVIATSTDIFPDAIACNDLSRPSPLTIQQDQTLATMQLQPYQQIEFDITINSLCSYAEEWRYDCNVFWIGTSAAKTDRAVALWIRIRQDNGQQSWEPRFSSNDNFNHALSITDPAPTIGTHHFSMFVAPNQVILGIDDAYTNVTGEFNRSNYFGTQYNIAFGSPYFADWGTSDATVSNLCFTSSCTYLTDFDQQMRLPITVAQTVATMQLEPYQSIEFDIDIHYICSHDLDNGGGANDCNILWIGTNATRSDRVMGLWMRRRKTTGEISWEARFASNENWNNVISITDPSPTVGWHHFSMFISQNQVIVTIDGVMSYDSSSNYNRSDYFGITYNVAFSSPNWNEWRSANGTVSNIRLNSWNMDGCVDYVVPTTTGLDSTFFTTTMELETTAQPDTTTTAMGLKTTVQPDTTTTAMELETTAYDVQQADAVQGLERISMVVVFVSLSLSFCF